MKQLSRGTLAPKQTLEGFFLGESVPVNRCLSDIFCSFISVNVLGEVFRLLHKYMGKTHSNLEKTLL